MKKFVLGLIVLLSAGIASAQEKVPADYYFTLEDCLNYAFGNNYNLQSAKLTEDSKENAYNQSKMERLPSLNASVGENYNHSNNAGGSWGGNIGLNANLTLYQGGNISNAIEQSKLLKEQSSFQTSQYQNNLTIQILQSFLTILGNEELLKYQAVVVKASEEQLKQGKAQYQQGQIL